MDLEKEFGDPYLPGNPLGHHAIIEADERGEVFEAGEKLLDSLSVNAEFVPRRLGGRLGTADEFIRRLRPVFRRDAALGIGYGVPTLLASLNVWLAADNARQQDALAVKILGGSKVCLAHGTPGMYPDPAALEVTARERGGRHVLDGHAGLVFNSDRADNAVVIARTAYTENRHSRSLLLVDLTALPNESRRRSPRVRTLGLRDCHLGGLEFSMCPVPQDSLIGSARSGADLARRSSEIGGCLTMGLSLGMLDASLFTVMRFALHRRLYGRTVSDIPHAKATIAGAFADLLIADCLVTTVARALHVLPGHSRAYAAASRYLVPLLLENAMNELSVVLGARYYLREGEHAIFGKHFRDLPSLSLLYPDRTPEITIAAHLPAFAHAQRYPSSSAASASIFTPEMELPPLEHNEHPARAQGDPLLACLEPWLDELRGEAKTATDLSTIATLLLTELEHLATHVGQAHVWQLDPANSTDSDSLAERYAVLLAATACLGIWRHNRDRRVLAGPAWIRVALRRLLGRLMPGTPPSARELDEELFTELLTRAAEGTSFCLDEDPVHRTLPR
ncbi:type I polyketide synthase component [Amycolatopsis decaplanina DSM 44594]|uniref:Type I polyketide synthase component n=1 Tax=Amycolatopsis decaplanina DSM 44594 TaxID=1284240 RepID=M2ZCJ1_9PSEU|nr:type I polyketide synthase component [Amycolatopsis decaplanina DSM 44594]